MKKNYINLMSLASAVVLGLGAVSLVSCGSIEDPTPEPVVVTTFSVSNKTELQEEWKVGEDSRLLEFDFGGVAVNPLTALNKKNLTVVSSDTNVVSTLGLNINAVGAGTATITATYINDSTEEGVEGTKLTDTFEVTVKENDKEELPTVATVKEFTEAAYDSTVGNKKSYLVTGTIEKRQKDESTDGGTYGNLYLKDDTGSVYIYGCTATNSAITFVDGVYKFSNPKDYLTNEWTAGLKVGDEVTMVLIRCDYKTTIEGTGYFVNGPKGRVAATPMSVGKVVADSYFNSALKVYHISGTIKGFGSKEASLSETADGAGQYGNMFVTGEDGTTVQVYGSTASTGAIAWNGEKLKFTNPKDFQTNSVTSGLKAGDKVEMDVIRCDYNGIIEVTGEITKVGD